jgi:hypothetical protein
MPRTDIDEPNRENDRSEILDPTSAKSNTAMVEPWRANALSDKEDPK